ncbi:hypothetical protein HXP81_003355 [Salmonella enterica]|nr:hypothetical protein [Salmonella enterica]EIV4812170.1 hypothetical protein [Salmonella enterica]EME7020148.1 hypothetical protein [Salmonella enterica]
MVKRNNDPGRRGLPVLLSALLMCSPLALAATADVSVEGAVVTPTCAVSGPASHSLGNMTPGTKQQKSPYTLQVTCQTDRAYLLYGEALSVASQGQDSVGMKVDGQVPAIAQQTTLKLLSNGTAIRLDGTGSTDDGATFCMGTTAQSCTLVPEVDVPAGALKGSVSATLRFSLRHP